MKKWQSLITNFIWTGKFHRISFKIMQQLSRRGDLGISDLEPDYHTANLANILRALEPQSSLDWSLIEAEGLQINNTAECIWQEKHSRNNKALDNQFLHIILNMGPVEKKINN